MTSQFSKSYGFHSFQSNSFLNICKRMNSDLIYFMFPCVKKKCAFVFRKIHVFDRQIVCAECQIFCLYRHVCVVSMLTMCLFLIINVIFLNKSMTLYNFVSVCLVVCLLYFDMFVRELRSIYLRGTAGYILL